MAASAQAAWGNCTDSFVKGRLVSRGDEAKVGNVQDAIWRCNLLWALRENYSCNGRTEFEAKAHSI